MTEATIERLYAFYGVLYNRYRLRILALCEETPHTSADLSRTLKLSYSITIKYVQMLADARLVSKTRHANRVFVRSLVRLTSSGMLERL